MKPTTNYISSLTPLRGIAALLVVLFHYQAFSVFHGFPGLLDQLNSQFITKGYLWVDFFFILSGFVISHVYGEKLKARSKGLIKNYLWARFSRLYPLHIFVMLLLAIQMIGLNLLNPVYASVNWNADNTISAFFIQLFFLQTSGLIDTFSWNVASWSVAAEWWTYIVAIGLIPLLNKGFTRYTILAFILALSGMVFITFQTPDNSINAIFALGTVRCIFEFTIGIGVYQAYKSLLNKKSFWSKDWFLYVILLCLIATLNFGIYDVVVIPFFGAFILCASLNTGRPYKLLNTKPLVFLGDISYSIYLIHLFWLFFYWIWLDLYFVPAYPGVMPTFWDNLLWITILMALIISSSAFTYKFVELRMQNKLRQWIQTKPKQVILD
ncbi:acyltransferase [Gaetbulibacter aquiaggeris]|uniref:Acyltransferase n=1 Tax=Gaetbulibacter aquiaggeris TaxID=1735373 RepID=A0ABW7MQX6_9FLAO